MNLAHRTDAQPSSGVLPKTRLERRPSRNFGEMVGPVPTQFSTICLSQQKASMSKRQRHKEDSRPCRSSKHSAEHFTAVNRRRMNRLAIAPAIWYTEHRHGVWEFSTPVETPVETPAPKPQKGFHRPRRRANEEVIHSGGWLVNI